MFYFFKIILRYIHTLFCYTDTSKDTDAYSLRELQPTTTPPISTENTIGIDSDEEYVSLPYLNEHDPYYDINVPSYTLT